METSETPAPLPQQAAGGQRKPLYRDEDKSRIVATTAKPGDNRSEYRRDWARLVHSSAFRRLQGKSQLFPPDESDFFRNRLTHSLEVAQIATGIALDQNGQGVFVEEGKIDVDIVHFAALAHDIGHPPFGHNGERALNLLMKDHGGFEGNAQTLRILAKIEKKATLDFPLGGDTPTIFKRFRDQRVGLNLTMRSLAGILKYDNIIKGSNKGKLIKGYYASEQDLVEKIKKAVVGESTFKKFRTIECTIMDLADDIAYSTYDLEDALKGGFISAASLLSIGDRQKEAIIAKVNEKMKDHYEEQFDSVEMLTPEEFNEIIVEVIGDILVDSTKDMKGFPDEIQTAVKVGTVYSRSCELADNGYIRSDFTSKLVSKMMRAVVIAPNYDMPMLTKARFQPRMFKTIEMLKRISFMEVIDSNRVKMGEFRGAEILKTIFNSLVENDDGIQLLPSDWQRVAEMSGDKYRAVCDFMSGMTDRYCLEFYSRLVGVSAPSIQKPY